jgi:phage tail-like protein
MLASLTSALLLLTTNPTAHVTDWVWVQPVHATVQIGGLNVGGFSEVTGLSTDTDVVEYRAGADQTTPRKIPGVSKFTDVTLKRGVVPDSSLYDWYKSKAAKTIMLKVMPTSGPAKNFHLHDCTPVKYTGPPLHGKGSGAVAIEELVLSCEYITLDK